MSRRERRYEQQAKREVGRAELLLAAVENIAEERAAKTLRDDARYAGISVHAAALAALAAGPGYISERDQRPGPC